MSDKKVSIPQWKVEECSSTTVNTPDPIKAIDELGNPDKCPTCNGYHMGGCHRAKKEPAANEQDGGSIVQGIHPFPLEPAAHPSKEERQRPCSVCGLPKFYGCICEPAAPHVCKPSCHNPCLLDEFNPWKEESPLTPHGEAILNRFRVAIHSARPLSGGKVSDPLKWMANVACKVLEEILMTPSTLLQSEKPAANPVPMRLFCPKCRVKHIDEGEWATRHHKTHQCQSCKHEWRPYEYATVGIEEPAAKPEPPCTLCHGSKILREEIREQLKEPAEQGFMSAEEFWKIWREHPEIAWFNIKQVCKFAEAYADARDHQRNE